MKQLELSMFGKLPAIFFILAGIGLCVWSVTSFLEYGITPGDKFTPEGRDGTSIILLGVIGLCSLGYGYFQLLSKEKSK